MVRDGETLGGENLHDEGGNKPGEGRETVEHEVQPIGVVEDHVHEEDGLHYGLRKKLGNLRRSVASAL